MTDIAEKIKELDALEAKATPGPWAVLNKRRVMTAGPVMSYMAIDYEAKRAVSVGSENDADHEFIAALRNAWPEIRTALLEKGLI